MQIFLYCKRDHIISVVIRRLVRLYDLIRCQGQIRSSGSLALISKGDI